MSHYDRVAAVIRYIDERRSEQPDLAAIAAFAGLSPGRLHRVFAEWAGVTPKDFLQCLTLEHARELLARGASVLESSLRSGLSGPGRLHDLCVTLEAATPGEVASGGRGLLIRFGIAASPFGQVLIGATPRGICRLAFLETGTGRVEIEELRDSWPAATFARSDDDAAALARRIFDPPTRSGKPAPLRAFLRGTTFQVRVWRALLTVEPGTLVSYGGLARAIGRPEAARAVGTAVGQNPLAYLIPCHRVIRDTGIFGAYRWGKERKRALVAFESLR